MRNAGLEEAQAGIKIAGRNINNLRYADDTTFMAESEEELKSLLMKVKVESEEVCLKLNIQKTKIMASGPITSWEIDGETVETVRFGAPKSLQMGDCSHEIKRRFDYQILTIPPPLYTFIHIFLFYLPPLKFRPSLTLTANNAII